MVKLLVQKAPGVSIKGKLPLIRPGKVFNMTEADLLTATVRPSDADSVPFSVQIVQSKSFSALKPGKRLVLYLAPDGTLPVNAAPTIAITSPAALAVFTAPGSITINATAGDADGTIAKVEFYRGATLVGTDTVAPFSVTITGVTAGTYSLTAKATDNEGKVTTSAPVSITVNAPPTVSITSPADAATFGAPATVNITANAADSDGTIASVAFYQGAVLLGTDTISPYSFSWTSVGAGTYSLTARATDDKGAVTISAAISITVT